MSTNIADLKAEQIAVAVNNGDLTGLAQQVKDLQDALTAKTKEAETFKSQANAKIDARVEALAQAKFLQDQEIEASKAEEAENAVLKRPKTFSEYKSLSLKDQVRAQRLFGGEEFVGKLLLQQSRQAEANKWAATASKLAEMAKVHPGRRY